MNNNEYKGTVAEGIGNLVVVACHYLTREQAYSGNEIEVNPVNSIYIYIWNDNIQSFDSCHLIVKTMKPRYQSFTRIGRQSQSLKRQVYADWTSVSFPLCKPLHGQYKFERNHEKKNLKHGQLNAIHCRSKLFCS